MGCIVREILHAGGEEGIEATGWARVVETKRKNGSTVRSFMKQQGQLIDEPEEMCKSFQEQFGQFFVGSDRPDITMNLKDFLIVLPRFSGQDVEGCEGSITPKKAIKGMAHYGLSKAPDLDGLHLHYKLYNSIPNLSWHLLTSVYAKF